MAAKKDQSANMTTTDTDGTAYVDTDGTAYVGASAAAAEPGPNVKPAKMCTFDVHSGGYKSPVQAPFNNLADLWTQIEADGGLAVPSENQGFVSWYPYHAISRIDFDIRGNR